MLGAIPQPLMEWVTAGIGGYGFFAVFGLMLSKSTGISVLRLLAWIEGW